MAVFVSYSIFWQVKPTYIFKAEFYAIYTLNGYYSKFPRNVLKPYLSGDIHKVPSVKNLCSQEPNSKL